MSSGLASRPPSEAKRLPLPLVITGTIVVGILATAQARINGELGAQLQDGFLAALLSYASGLAILVAMTLSRAKNRTAARSLFTSMRRGEVPTWILVGSLAGAFAVLTQGLVVGITGVALFAVGIVAGRTSAAVIIDRTGLGTGVARKAGPSRILGAVLTIAAVLLGVTAESLGSLPWWAITLPFLAGAGIAVQQAANGNLVRRTRSGTIAALVNFSLGTALLGALCLARFFMGYRPEALPPLPWLYAGGVIGVVFIVMSALLVRHTGVLLLGIGIVVGQLASSVAMDAIWAVPSAPPWYASLGAVLLAIVAAVIAAEPFRKHQI